MPDKYIEKYRMQMDKITLSESADQRILDDLLKAEAGKGESYIKRPQKHIRAAAAAAAVIIAGSAAAAAGAAIHGIIIRSEKTESELEDSGASTVNVGESYYYDLLAGDSGEIYALTDNDYYGELTEQHAIVWKSADQCDTWESVLFQPDDLNEESSLFAGDLREGPSGIEAVVIIQEDDPNGNGSYTNRVYQVSADSFVEYNMDEVYALLGSQDHLFNVKYVNDHVIALIAAETCLLYDTDTQEIIKELPYDLTMGCLLTQDQFLILGKEISACLDADTLEEQAPDPVLQEFVLTMFASNGNDVFPPMQAQDDTIICVTATGIYEYCAGETKQIRQLSSAAAFGDHALNGLLPVCRGQENEYYVCIFGGTGMNLWKIDSDTEEMK